MDKRVQVKDNKLEANQFRDIQDKDLRCRNIATMILNYWEDKGEDTALQYAAINVRPADEEHVKGWVKKLAEERGHKFMVH